MDWRATVNLTIIASFTTLIFLWPYSVEGRASLRGIEHSYRVGRPIHSQRLNNHVQHDTTHHIHQENHVSTIHELDKDYNDIEYENYDDDIAFNGNDDYYDDNPDRSYKYEFEADGYRKSESSDFSGNVVGSYSYVDAEGKERSLSYRAGANIGFVPFEAEGLHPEVMASFEGFGKRHGSKGSATPSSILQLNPRSSIPSRRHEKSSRTSTKSSHRNSQGPGYDTKLSNTKTTSSRQGNNGDQSNTGFNPYSFGFDEKDSLRQESGDRSGSVKGRYSYTNQDGNTIEVKYSAGAEKGFVIENEAELAKSVAKATSGGSSLSSNIDLSSSPTILDVRKQYNSPDTRQYGSSDDSSTISFVGSNIDENTWESDGTYSFGYKSADSARSEVADKNGIVTGSYVTLDACGLPMTVRYRAGGNIGYVVENLDEVNARSVPQPNGCGESSNDVQGSTQTNSIVSNAIQSQNVSPVVGSGVLPPKTYQYPTSQTQTASASNKYETASLPVDEKENDYDDYYDPDADRSYAFSYAEDRGIPGWISKRQEEADSNGQVKGRYSYVNDDGNEIAVQYSAGAGIGFVVENKDELKAQVRKATLHGASKISRVKVVKKAKSKSKSKGTTKRRMVVRKGQRRISQAKPKASHATPLSIVSKSMSTGRKPLVTIKTKQEGQECGSCFSPDTNYDCGSCAPGLECIKDTASKLLPDAPSRCRKKPVSTITARRPSKSYSLPRKPSPTPPSNLYGAPSRNPSPTPPTTLYSAPEKSRSSKFESFPLLEVAKFITPQGNLLSINGNKDTDVDDSSYDYYNGKDYGENSYNGEDYEENSDASFNFSFESKKLAREETSDQNGERFGSYSYVNPSGGTITVRYRAGVNGFEILNPEDVLPKAPTV